MKLLIFKCAIFLEVLLCMGAMRTGVMLMDWQGASRELVMNSPDATHTITHLLLGHGLFSGGCVGVALVLGMAALGEIKGSSRLRLADAGFSLLIALPVVAVVIMWAKLFE